MSRPGRTSAPLLVLLGPTGTGKTEVAVGVARRLGGEVVGCDAVQVYRGFDAATAKPLASQREAVPHHLVDCIDPRVDFSMADYVREAEAVIAGVLARGCVPLVVGGSGLYLRGLLRGVIAAPPRDAAFRERLRAIAGRGGAERLRGWLRRRDPDSEARIPRGDLQRLIRAIELARDEGGTWSERLRAGGSWSAGDERYRALKVGLDTDRNELAAALDGRVNRFFDGGLVEEVRGLLREGVPPQANAFKAIGYREVLSALDGGGDPSGVRERVQRNTRRFVKRQRTWFRSEANVVWLDAAIGVDAVVEQIVTLWREDAF